MFPTIIIFVIFWTGGKYSLDCLEKKYGNIGRYFCSSIAIFLEFYWKFDNKQEEWLWLCFEGWICSVNKPCLMMNSNVNFKVPMHRNFCSFFIGSCERLLKTEKAFYRLSINVYLPEIWAFKVTKILRKMRKENWAFCVSLAKNCDVTSRTCSIQYFNSLQFRHHWSEVSKTWVQFNVKQYRELTKI